MVELGQDVAGDGLVSRGPWGSARRSCRRTRPPASSPRRDSEPSSRRVKACSSPSSSWNAPVMAPRISPGVTMPSKWPYSSNTSAICTTEARMAVSTVDARRPGRAPPAPASPARGYRAASPERRCRSGPCAAMTPMIWSGSPSCTGSIEWCDERSLCDGLFERLAEIDEFDLEARRHQAARRAVGEAHHARDHARALRSRARPGSRPRR